MWAGSYVGRDPVARPSANVEIEISAPNEQGQIQHGICSGVYLGKGTVLTAKHCATGEISGADIVMQQNDKPGAKIAADVVWKSDEVDLAAYRTDGDIDAHSATLACRNPVIIK